jgi:hypothetical protein
MQRRDDSLDALCSGLLDDPFVPRPSPDDMCLLALRILAA